MFAASRGFIIATTLHNRNNVARPALVVLCRSTLLQPGVTQCRRSLTTSKTNDSTEGPQSHEKTEHARRKVQDGSGSSDPRMKEIDDLIRDKFAQIRQDDYAKPKNPIILAHGLLGFEELQIAGPLFPGIQYWRGITQALAAKGVEVYTASVSPSGSIEARAAKLAEVIEQKCKGKSVNIIAGKRDSPWKKVIFNKCTSGLDSRYMISQLKPPNVNVLSLTTIATPHRGSAFADYMFELIGPRQMPKLYKVLEFFGMETGAFSQLTQKYMTESFNPRTPDREGVRYFSYGAIFTPRIWSAFRQSHNIVQKVEGDNDGLVSATSARWGDYKGTIDGVNHLDLINWTNRIRWWVWEVTGHKRTFNAIALYLDIADMLAKEGL